MRNEYRTPEITHSPGKRYMLSCHCAMMMGFFLLVPKGQSFQMYLAELLKITTEEDKA